MPLDLCDATAVDKDVVRLALRGLTAKPKTLPPKLFYDAAGVALFNAITRLPEYYPTRTERALLTRIAPDIAALIPAGATLVEYGASDEAKAEILLDAAGPRIAAYAPIDVAAAALAAIKARLARRRPALRVHPICADFEQPPPLGRDFASAPKFGFFPGSTIGNFDPAGARQFLAQARTTLGPGGWLIVGVDLRKSPSILVPAYDDADGVTAAFNLNLLHRLNREAAADFVPAAFQHRAVWNAGEGRIEMHLVSLKPQTVHVAGVAVNFAAGETIHTENSYKYDIAGFQSLAAASGWTPAQHWTDPDMLFSVHALAC